MRSNYAKSAVAGIACLALLAGSVQATTVGFVGAAGVNVALPANYASNVTASGTGWTTTDGTGATPFIGLDWGNGTLWRWEFHNADTFANIEDLHSGGAWDAVAPTNTAVAQLETDQPNGALKINFSVISGVRLVLNSLDIGNAVDQLFEDGPYGFDLALVKNSNSSVVWTHSTPEFEAGEQQSVAINYTGDPGEDYTLSFTRHGQGNGTTKRTGLDNLSFSQIVTSAAPQFQLIVDRATGGVSLKNIGTSAATIKGYSITSDAGALNSSGWKPIAGNYDINGNGSVDPNDDWSRLTKAGDVHEFAEYEFGGNGATIAAGSTVVLNQAAGNAWVKSPFQEVALDLILAGGDIVSNYTVQYINGPAGGYAIGDLNFDGVVNAADWPAYHAGRGVDMSGMTAVAAYRLGDLDGDLDNDIADFVLFKQLSLGGTAASVAVPEPLTLSLLFAACGALCVLRPLKSATYCDSTCRRRKPVTTSPKLLVSAILVFASIVGTAQATTIGFRGAQSANNLDIPVNYGSNIGSNGTGWTVADGTGATPNIGLNWGGGGSGGTGWDWEYHTAATFQYIEALHAGGTWDAQAPPSTNAVAQLQDYRPNGAVELQFTVNAGYRVILNSFDIGNAYDQVSGDGEYGFHIELVKDSNSSVVWSHDTPIWGVGTSGREQSVNVGYTGDPGASYTLTFTRIDAGIPGNNEIYRSGLDNLSFSEEAVALPMKLVVNTINGVVELKNQTGQSHTIDSYEITSASNSLDPVHWYSLQDRDYEGNGAPGSGNGWEEAPGADAGALIEDYYNGSSTIANGASIWLGQAFDHDKIGVQQDLLFGYHIVGDPGVLRFGDVEYVAIAVPGDYNSNGIVDAADYSIWRDTLGSTTDLRANGDNTGASAGKIDQADYTYWKSRFGNISGSGSAAVGAAAVPEPGTLSLLGLFAVALVLGSRLSDQRARGTRSSSLRWVMALAAILTVAQSALAAKTNDRRYEFGDGGTSNTQDSQFISADDKQDLSVGSGSPTFVNVSSTGLNRPGATTGDKGAQFNGTADVLSGIALNRPSETAGPDFDGLGPILYPYPFNYNTITTRGLQMWVYPDASAIGTPQSPTNRQDIVFDSRVAGGVSITADGKWTQSFSTFRDDNQIGDTVSVVGNQWYHVMHHIYHSSQPGFPAPVSNARSYTAVVYVNGVAVSASNDTIYGCSLVGSCAVPTYTGKLVVGGSEIANDGVTALYDNHFKGTVDDLEMYVYGDNSSNEGPPAGQNYGTFSLFSDNAYIAGQIAAIPGGILKIGDLNRDGSVNQSDVTPFVANWRREKRLQGIFSEMIVGDWETWGWGDLNTDGVVDLHDAIMLDQALISAGAGSLDFSLFTNGSVPEPSSLVVVCAGLLSAGCCRTRRRVCRGE